MHYNKLINIAEKYITPTRFGGLKRREFMEKIKLGIIYGGMSTEHEVSVTSAKSVISNLNKEKYEILPIYIDKKGNWNIYEKDINEIKILDIEEKIQLEEIVKNIGKFDVANEIDQIDTFLITIESKFKQAEMDKIKICPMILKLSLLFAVGLAIILI